MYMYIPSESVNRRVAKDTDIHYADPFVKFELEALAVSTCFTLTIVHFCRHAVVPWLFFTRVTRPVINPECSVHGKSFTQAQVKMESSKWLFVRSRQNTVWGIIRTWLINGKSNNCLYSVCPNRI